MARKPNRYAQIIEHIFTVDLQRAEADDPVRYLAIQSDLGIVKRQGEAREKARLDKLPQELNSNQLWHPRPIRRGHPLRS